MPRRAAGSNEGTSASVSEPLSLTHAPPPRSRKTIAGQFDPSIARAVAILAAKEGRTIGGLLGEAIHDLLQKYQQEI